MAQAGNGGEKDHKPYSSSLTNFCAPPIRWYVARTDSYGDGLEITACTACSGDDIIWEQKAFKRRYCTLAQYGGRGKIIIGDNVLLTPFA